jgi:hypothetical protein
MPALSMESLEQACADIITSLSILQAASKEENPKVLMKQHLGSGRTKGWLVVVDNVDDLGIISRDTQSQGIVDYLPESDQRVVVYTARRPEMAELTRDDVLEIEATAAKTQQTSSQNRWSGKTFSVTTRQRPSCFTKYWRS